VQAQPRLLDDVLGFGRVAQQATGNPQQPQSLALVDRRQIHARQIPSAWSVREMTHAG